ncbi:ISL3 family transposase, partial [Streptomyces sp. NPDC056056]|uniref:ISL3 family transposase n=1 Tax=Streptomyces sp. NPDC056056 TaxID=3345698 RepID=UPI0035E345CF
MEEVVLQLEELLFPSISDVAVLSVDVTDEAVRIEAQRTVVGSDCPGCVNWSRRIHSSYLRFLVDVPSGGRRVVLSLRVRRFLCPVISCGRWIFVEQMPGLTRRYGRRTERLRSTLAAVGLALAGRAGARMARVFGLSVSRSTVLRLTESLPDPELPAPRVVGVDEYATRKGRHYGTVLFDVESRRPVDLLPYREASSLAAWLAKRPGVEVVCRDRAPFFAEGATAGAPQAVQVADRWHVWHNLSEAAERCVADHLVCLRVLAPDPAQPASEPEKFEDPSGSPWPRGHRCADRTRANHATVHELLTAGLSRRAIGRQLLMTSRTVKLFAGAATRRTSSAGSGRAGRPSWTRSSPTWMTAGTRIARTPGRYGRSLCRSAIRAATSAFAPTSGRSGPLPTRSQLGHRHPVSSPAGSSGAPRPSRRSTAFGS